MLRTYIDAFYGSDADELANVFHQSAHLYSVEQDGPRCLPVAAYLDVVRARKPIDVVCPIREVTSLSFINANIVLARVSLENTGSYFEDSLVLARDGDGWKILSKTYAARPKA